MAALRCHFVVLAALLMTCSAVDARLNHLRFYFHEVIVGAPNATIVNIVSLHRRSSTFGDVDVLDNALRTGPHPSSRLIGRAQGFTVQSSLDDSGYLTAINFIFTDCGAYSDSTLATLGLVNNPGPWSERTIVGGTGRLRFAQGYMVSKILSSTDTYLVVLFDMYFTLPSYHGTYPSSSSSAWTPSSLESSTTDA